MVYFTCRFQPEYEFATVRMGNYQARFCVARVFLANEAVVSPNRLREFCANQSRTVLLIVRSMQWTSADLERRKSKLQLEFRTMNQGSKVALLRGPRSTYSGSRSDTDR